MIEARPRRRRVWLILMGTVALLGGAALVWWLLRPEPPTTGLRTYTAARIAEEIRIDGELTEDAWARAAIAGPFVMSDGRAHAPLRCVARLVWDEEALYVAFEAEDHDVLSPHRKRDDPLWTKDVVEVFLDPDGDGRYYYEFQASPRSTLFDALFPSHREHLKRSMRWNARGLQSAVVVDGTPDAAGPDAGYVAELRIPFASIRHAPRSPPRIGDVWRMNLFRIDIHEEGGHYTAWTPPIAGDFHTLDRFGFLVFGPAF